jgi:hypothetical protein
MNLKFLKIILISLILTLSEVSFAEGNSGKILDGMTASPAGFFYLTEDEMKELNKFKRNCDRSSLDRDTYKGQYEKCVSGAYCEEALNDSRGFFWSGVAGAFIVGFLVASSNQH